MSVTGRLLLEDLERKATILMLAMVGWSELHGDSGPHGNALFETCLDLVQEIRKHLKEEGDAIADARVNAIAEEFLKTLPNSGGIGA